MHPGDPEPLNAEESRGLRVVRWLGIVGALFLAFGSLGAGAAPILNPVFDIPVLRLFARIPTVSLAIAFAGMGMMVAGWLLLGRFSRPGRTRLASPGQLYRTLAMWTIPLLVIPPLFSRDVYSYLAQSAIVHRGMDPYALGPAQALGVADPLTAGVSNMWRETPAPYGPLFLDVGSWISGLVGTQVAVGVLLMRGLALVGLALIVWSLPRLARRFGVQPTTALWLGAANPLVLFHLVAGAHNEALGIGLMLAGLEIGIRKLPMRVSGDSPPPLAKGELMWIVLGAVVITGAAMVKIHAVVALGFFGVMIARRWHGKLMDLVKAAALMTLVCVAVTAGICFGTGLGFGWVSALGTPGMVWNWISPLAELGQLGGILGITLGLGNHTAGVIAILGILGYAVAGAITVKFLWDSFRWRYRPIIGLGVSLGAFMVLHVAMQPWWLLWAVIPLAASAGTSRFRAVATAVSAVLAMVIPPTGSTFDGRSYIVSQAYIAGGIVLLLTLVIVWRAAPMLFSPRLGQTRHEVA
ncbi:polyprenol phosphomannose-dependent alpha 1,6 mannosyltransferase MptB [Prauserella sp. ASG 168]|uniref:Polyprenol phosphomannose-dependent alpha 1,6 mannosyltransferase MptB n=1 Tax=Prauserella cavernicola TaxID=2800127 RepID=A0A934QXB7_9PSEU|nr:polyprenol phosphomannose-dependent alpha 1,6 mannosyltransferase MptB [Prauserella cavernicola]MBK1788208.1 polyprenol phosphomannose-dependent alpha 1,6 mannosyltransferase MptB [Prauserella cavernicola]